LVKHLGKDEMGCDIFSWVEVKDPITGRWAAVFNAFPSDQIEKNLYNLEFLSSPFRARDYRLFGFLAGVRSYGRCEPLATPRGLPDDCDLAGARVALNQAEIVLDLRIEDPRQLREEFHSHSWFLLSELLEFSYDKTLRNPSVSGGRDGAVAASDGIVRGSYRDFLGNDYFSILSVMNTLGKADGIRVVFCFCD
jgi:hypothetical protein